MTETAKDIGLMAGHPPPTQMRVTLENFLYPPFNRWALQHMRELVPTRPVSASENPILLNVAKRDLSDLPIDFPESGTKALKSWLHDSYTDGYIVLHRGNIVFEHYANGQSPATQHLMFSVTKSVTGTLTLMAIERGQLDEDRNVAFYVPELAGSAFGDASVSHLLDMTNSVKFDEVYADETSPIAQYLYAMLPGGAGICGYLPSLTDRDSDYPHGSAFHYVTPKTDALAWCLRRATGCGLADLLGSWIWEPMGAEHEAHYWLDFQGTEFAGGGLSMTLRDAARFGQLILQDGRVGDRQVIPASVARRIKTPRNQDLFAIRQDDPWYGNVGSGYHDQWWSYKGMAAVTGIGIHGQYLTVNADADLVIVKQSSRPEASNDRDDDPVLAMKAIAAALA
ncbi:MAG: serine hydrolase [Alphaproteobacteria bacterium]